MIYHIFFEIFTAKIFGFVFNRNFQRFEKNMEHTILVIIYQN